MFKRTKISLCSIPTRGQAVKKTFYISACFSGFIKMKGKYHFLIVKNGAKPRFFCLGRKLPLQA